MKPQILAAATTLLNRIDELAPTANAADLGLLAQTLSTINYCLTTPTGPGCTGLAEASACEEDSTTQGETPAPAAPATRTRRTKAEIEKEKAAATAAAQTTPVETAPAAASVPAEPDPTEDDDPTKDPVGPTYDEMIAECKKVYLQKTKNYGETDPAKCQAFKEKMKALYTSYDLPSGGKSTRIGDVPEKNIAAFHDALVNG